ncbi:MAG TPA: N-acetyltransferase [Aliidongia sp.]|uniref:GNAT family N-acetyltransferase n=1 Tax=Aliidongia sp. TaxID=1914230 RepID=UPI002DDC99B1|nr:N-acetyltransferase [Aliidongia sp.]HEV2674518.1 N-acetyltransferase [Aliidongia sp.]
MAEAGDVPALVALETASFALDRISPRSWRRLLVQPGARVLVAPGSAAIDGALVLLFRRHARIGRIYSIAVAAEARGIGIGGMLIEWAALLAAVAGCTAVRLETRIDNRPAQALFARHGFKATGRADGYYQDGTAALRLERPIHTHHCR